MNEEVKRIAEERGLVAALAAEWRCHICGDERPDALIGVAKHVHIYPSGIRSESFVRFCADRERCRFAASIRDHTMIALAETHAEIMAAHFATHRIRRRLPVAFLLGVIFTLAVLGLAVSFAVGA